MNIARYGAVIVPFTQTRHRPRDPILHVPVRRLFSWSVLAKHSVSWLQPLAPQRLPNRPISGAINPAAFPARSRSGCLALAALIILLFPFAALSLLCPFRLLYLPLASSSSPPYLFSRDSLLTSQILALVVEPRHDFRLSDHRRGLHRFFSPARLRLQQQDSQSLTVPISQSPSSPFSSLSVWWFCFSTLSRSPVSSCRVSSSLDCLPHLDSARPCCFIPTVDSQHPVADQPGC